MIKIPICYLELILLVGKTKLLSLCILDFIAFFHAGCVQSTEHPSLHSQQHFLFPSLRTCANPHPAPRRAVLCRLPEMYVLGIFKHLQLHNSLINSFIPP